MALDIEGRRFGKLRALRHIADSRLGRIWLCMCDCGEETERLAAELIRKQKNGVNQSCPRCSRRRPSKPTKKQVREELARRLGIGLISIIMMGCSMIKTRDGEECKASEERQAAFIIECARAANPHSDEEGEDLVAECRRTAQYVIKGECVPVLEYRVRRFASHGIWRSCSEAPHGSSEEYVCKERSRAKTNE